MSVRLPASRVLAVLIVLHAGPPAVSAAEADAAPSARRQVPSWGAIAAQPHGYGYSFNQKSRAAAEQAARAQCERPSQRQGTVGAKEGAAAAPVACEVRIVFDRGCAALVAGNFGEWGTATAATKEAAGKAAIAECNGRLPTEPCKPVVSVCSMN